MFRQLLLSERATSDLELYAFLSVDKSVDLVSGLYEFDWRGAWSRKMATYSAMTGHEDLLLTRLSLLVSRSEWARLV